MPITATQLSTLREMSLEELKIKASELKNKIEANKRIIAEKDNILSLKKEELTRVNPTLQEAWDVIEDLKTEEGEGEESVSREIMQFMESERKKELERPTADYQQLTRKKSEFLTGHDINNYKNQKNGEEKGIEARKETLIPERERPTNREVEDLRNQTRDRLWKEVRQRETEADQSREENRTERFSQPKPEKQSQSNNSKLIMQSIRAETKKFIEDEALKEI